jgi:hypothetical protein
MNLSRVLFVVCCSLSIAVAQSSPVEKPFTPMEQSMIGAEKTFIAAAKKGDGAYFKRTLTDDYSMVGSDGQLHDREETLAEFSGGGIDLMPYNVSVVALSESAVIVTYDVVMQIPATEDQGPPPRYQRWSTTWTKQGDQWKIKFQQATPTHWGDW